MNRAIKITTMAFFLIILSITIIASTTLNEFEDGDIVKILAYNDSEDLSVYLSIPMDAEVTSAVVDLTDIGKTWQYQETADDNHAEKGDFTPLEDMQNYIYIYSNYSKPQEAYKGSKWIIGYGLANNPIIENISIPDECFIENPLQFKAIVLQLGPQSGTPSDNYTIFSQCYDGNEWINLTQEVNATIGRSYQSGSSNLAYDDDWNTFVSISQDMWVKSKGSNYVFGIGEEGVYWFVNESNVSNVEIDVFNDSIVDYSNPGLWDGSRQEDLDIDLNASNINDKINNCSCDGCAIASDNCTFPLIIHSDTKGRLEVSNVNIEYCVADWTAEYTDCIDYNWTKYYTDANNCNTNKGLPEDNGTIETCCEENLTNSTGDWTNTSECLLNDTMLQERNITQYDANNCEEILGNLCVKPKSMFSVMAEEESSGNRTFTETRAIGCDYCEPNWTCSWYDVNGVCLDCLDREECFNQTNSSGDDYDGNYSEFERNGSNGVHNASDINASLGDTIEVYIGNHHVSEWETVTGMLDIDLRRGNKMVAEFDYNFTNGTIDFNNITAEQGNDNNGATKGYIVLSGVNTYELYGKTKTLYINRIDTKMNWVCVKDQEISDIEEITKNCKGENEYHVQCNGQDFDGYKCTYNSELDQYKITGLKHSGVM